MDSSRLWRVLRREGGCVKGEWEFLRAWKFDIWDRPVLFPGELYHPKVAGTRVVCELVWCSADFPRKPETPVPDFFKRWLIRLKEKEPEFPSVGQRIRVEIVCTPFPGETFLSVCRSPSAPLRPWQRRLCEAAADSLEPKFQTLNWVVAGPGLGKTYLVQKLETLYSVFADKAPNFLLIDLYNDSALDKALSAIVETKSPGAVWVMNSSPPPSVASKLLPPGVKVKLWAVTSPVKQGSEHAFLSEFPVNRTMKPA